jgi:hypothetical protein
VEDEVPDRLAELRLAGLARGHDLAPLRLERGPQQLHLRGLAGAVHSFERHEHQMADRWSACECGDFRSSI